MIENQLLHTETGTGIGRAISMDLYRKSVWQVDLAVLFVNP